MEFAISNIAWNKNEDDYIYEIMRKYGYKGLEIAPTRFFTENPYDSDATELINIKNKISKENIQIIAMQSILYGHPELKLFGKDEQRENVYNYLKKAIDFASVLGIGILVFGSPKNRIYINREKDFDIATIFFRDIGSYAYKKNVKLCIEPNPKEYNTNFINTTFEAYEFIKKVNSQGIGLHVDTGTILLNNEDLNILEKVTTLIDHVHISQPFLDVIKLDKKYEYLEISKKLKKIGYSKWVSIEMKGNLQESNYSNIEEAMKCINEVFGR